MAQLNDLQSTLRKPFLWISFTILAAFIGAFFIGVFNGAGYDIQKYGESFGRKMVAEPPVAAVRAAAKAKKEKIECQQALLKSIALEEDHVRSAKAELQQCKDDFRHWALGQSCESYERLVIANEARLTVMKEPGGC